MVRVRVRVSVRVRVRARVSARVSVRIRVRTIGGGRHRWALTPAIKCTLAVAATNSCATSVGRGDLTDLERLGLGLGRGDLTDLEPGYG